MTQVSYNSHMNNRNSVAPSPETLLPKPDKSEIAIGPPRTGAGYWSGGPSAAVGDDGIYLAYRLRRPIGAGRGYAVKVARSSDGVRFQTVATLSSDEFDAESLERPALVRTPGGGWRLYVSCATPGTKHWRIEVLEASHPSGFDASERLVVMPGDAATGVKDPVIRYRDGFWQAWVTCHPLADPDQADQMVTAYATSEDGLDWTWHGTALAGRPGAWDSRGTRVTAVTQSDGKIAAFYDGRATAAENYEERTGLALGTHPSALTAVGSGPAAESRIGLGGLRYLDLIALPGGGYRLYYELSRSDGSHELRTELR
jgi:hypothetical protein